LRNATVSFVKSGHPSARIEQLGSNWTDFHGSWYLNIKKNRENSSFINIGQKIVGSNPAEAVGFLRAEKSSAPLPSEGK
jgi:hypothetical protein